MHNSEVIIMLKNHTTTSGFRKQQQGVATLLVSLVLLLGITLMTFSAARVAITEQRISADDYRSKQAFEAAQAGLETGFADLAIPAISLAVRVDNNADGILDPVAGLNPSAPIALANGASAAYSYAMVGGDINLINITATGTADGGSATQTVSQMGRLNPRVPDLPTTVSKDNISFIGLLTRIRTNPAACPSGNTGAWSGGNTSVNLGLPLQNIVGGILPGVCTVCIQTDDGTTGIAENDANLRDPPGDPAKSADDRFFENIFNDTRANVRKDSVILTGANINLLNICTPRRLADRLPDALPTPTCPQPGQTIWVDAGVLSTAINAGLLTTIGSHENPVTLIVNGDLNISASVLTSFFGTIYTTGDAVVAGVGFNLEGSLVAEGDVLIAAAATDLRPQPCDGRNLLVARVSGSWFN